MKWRSLEESAAATETRSLAEIFSERKELIAKYVPAEVQAIHARAITEVRNSGIAGRALQSGDKAPGFELADQKGLWFERRIYCGNASWLCVFSAGGGARFVLANLKR